MYYDASRISLGCVLMHNGKVITYASQNLNKHEQNYPTHDLEMIVVLFALKVWRQFSYDKTCEIYADLKSVKYTFEQCDLNLR